MESEIIGGEVWTDERGEAVVVLPDHLHSRDLEYGYRLICTDPAEAAVEVADGQLTITAAAPHLKVRWRLAYRTAGESPCEGGETR